MKTNPNYLFLLAFFLAPLFSAAGWDPISPYPSTATDGAFTFTIAGKAYVGGGLADNRLYVYDPAGGQWSRLADVPGQGVHRAWAYSFTVNGKGYVAGGSYGDASELDNDLWEYDPATDEWTQKADFPGGARDAGFSFSIGDKGYIGAGFDGQYLQQDLYSYEPAQDKWTKLTDFPGGPVIFPAAFAIDGRAYVGTGGQGSSEIQGFWEFNPSGNSWKAVADFAGDPRQCAVAVVIGGKGYVGGGMTGYTTNRTDFWEFDAAANTWKEVAGADLPTSNTAWSTAFALGTTVYFGLGVDFPAFTFSGDFYKRSFNAVLGDKETGPQLNVLLYPVPARDRVTVQTGSGVTVERLCLYDSKGSLCGTYSGNEMNVSHLAAGYYLIRLFSEEGAATIRFYKE